MNIVVQTLGPIELTNVGHIKKIPISNENNCVLDSLDYYISSNHCKLHLYRLFGLLKYCFLYSI